MMGLLLDEIVNYQTHAFFSEGHLYLCGPSSLEGPLVEGSWRLGAQLLVGSGAAPPGALSIPFHFSPGENHLHQSSVTVVLESPGCLLCMCWFSENTGQIRGLEIVQGVCFHDLPAVSLRCFCLFQAVLISVRLNRVPLPFGRSEQFSAGSGTRLDTLRCCVCSAAVPAPGRPSFPSAEHTA